MVSRSAQQAANNAYFVNLFRSELQRADIDNAFIEYRKLKIGTLRLSIIRRPHDRFLRSRFFYTGTRASGAINTIVDRKRGIDPRIQIGLSGKF